VNKLAGLFNYAS